MNVRIDEERTIRLLSDLTRIDSVNPDLVPGAKGESEIARLIVDMLKGAGVEAHLQEAAPGRPNAVGILRGTGGGRRLVLNGHEDTVSLEGMAEPLSGRVADGRLHGRGSLDCKAGLAAGLSALLAIHDAGVRLRGDLIVVGAADEEYASRGSEAFVREYGGDGWVILEPRGMKMGVAQGGFIWANIDTEGVAAHGSAPQAGVDAIVKMGPVLTELGQLNDRIFRDKSFVSPLSGVTMRPSLHGALVKGGRELSSYPDHCRLQIERRMIPGETKQDVDDEVMEILTRLGKADPQFKATWDPFFVRLPWQARPGPLLDTLETAFAQEMGRKPERAVSMGWNDSAIADGAGIPTVVFGPLGEGIHSVAEYADVQSVIDCARVLARAAMEFCA
jgi:acetylornithine deacetylase